MYNFNGKIALVTGGAGGIGLCLVKELLKNGAEGIVIADVNTDVKVIQEISGNNVYFIQTDVTNAKEFEDAFKYVITKFGRLDILLNNAGILNDNTWELEIQINSVAVVRGTLLGMQYMGKDKGGQGGIIVNTASILGLMGLSGCPVYSATKHFVVGLSRSMGTPFYYGTTGVKVLTICPSVTDTALVSNATAHGLKIFDGLDDLLYNQLTNAYPTQEAENVGKALIQILNEAENGSTWVVEDNKLAYEVKPLIPTLA